MRQRLLLSSYMKGFAAGADLSKGMKRTLDQDVEIFRAWAMGHEEGRKAARAAEETRKNALLAQKAVRR